MLLWRTSRFLAVLTQVTNITVATIDGHHYACLLAGEHDIAIIILAKPLTFSDKIRPVCLPSSEDNVYVGEKVTHMGWGMTGYMSEQSPTLKHVDLKVAQATSKKSENFLETEARWPELGAAILGLV